MGTYHGANGPCHRCGRGGHLARDCSLHTCFRCNGRGHMAWECVEGVTCSKCGEKGHLQRNCKNVSCHKCGRKGHIAKFCNDPFAKAAEVEKHERQQALLLARAPGSASQAVAELSSMVMRGAATGAPQKDIPGPWDGLGVTARDVGLTDREGSRAKSEVGADKSFPSGVGTENGAMNTALTGSRKRTVLSQRVRIVGVKRSGTRQNAISEGLKRKLNVSRTVEDPLVAGSTEPQWKGLVGYESEDSEDAQDHSVSSFQADSAN